MFKNRYKIFSIILLLVLIFNVGNSYAADHRLEEIEIEVYINEDGSAKIRERRIANLVEGTESFIKIENLGKSEIIDFKVYEDGKEFQYQDDWNIDNSREYKRGKNGIIEKSNGYELAWGIGEYGKHEYELEYTVTNFVKALEDSQMVNWRFVNDGSNTPPENVRLKISSDEGFNSEDQKIWGFGFDGEVEFDNGEIIGKSNGPLSRKHHVTILVKLPEGMFGTEDIIDKTFEEVKDQAFVGSEYTGEEAGGPPALLFIFAVFAFIIGILALVFGLIFGNMSKPMDKAPRVFKRKYKEEYYRDYPYDGNFTDIYYIPYIMGTANFKNLLTGFILKWINEDRIMTVEEEVGRLFKKDRTNLKFLNMEALENPLEDDIFQMILSASGENEILEEKEFTKWARSNIKLIEDWEKKIKDESIEKLRESGYLEIVEKRFLFFKIPNYELTERGKVLETNIYKYINYLHDFSLLNEHKAVNVKIWDDIMIWAGFLGLTEEVQEQFEKLYPRYSQETVYVGNTIFLTAHLAGSVSQTASTYSTSGLGGSTSIGGGGGSFGGGTGGGTR